MGKPSKCLPMGKTLNTEPVLDKIDLVSQFEQNTKVDISDTVIDIKKEIESCFDGIKTKLLQQLEDDIRNKVIQNIGSSGDIQNMSLSADEYGKINDSLYDINFCEIIGRYYQKCVPEYRASNYSRGAYATPSEMSEINIKKIIDGLNLNKLEYIIHYSIIFTCEPKYHENSHGHIDFRWSSGTYELILCTNLCNIFSITDQNSELNIMNVQLNTIFIDIIKSMSNEYHKDNTPKNICEVISKNIKKYWGTEQFGAYALKFEQLNTEHIDAKKELKIKKLKI